MDAKGNTLAALSFIAIILLTPTFLWHCSRKNIADILIIVWLILVNIITFINSIVWSRPNYFDAWDGRIYCDIVSRISLASSVGKLAAITASIINLYMILNTKYPKYIESTKFKIFSQLSICLIPPVYMIIISFFIQSPRYVIARYTGCQVFLMSNVFTLIAYNIFTVLWIIPASIFAILTLKQYLARRRDLKDILKCTNSGLSNKRFARLLIFSFLIILIMTPSVIVTFVWNVKHGLSRYNWKNFYDEHWNQVYYQKENQDNFYMAFTNIGLSFISFLLLGLGSDAIKSYKTAFNCICIKLHIKSEAKTSIHQVTSATDDSELTKSGSIWDSHIMDKRERIDLESSLENDNETALEYSYVLKLDNAQDLLKANTFHY